MLNFTAIDFETANSFRGSPCSVGLIRVRDGKPVEARHWLIRPPERADWFDSWNTAIHGITPSMVETAPRWRSALTGITDFIGNDIVVAHNAGFDIGVIRHACAVDDIKWPEMRFLCTLVMARRAISLPSYRLPYVSEHFGVALLDHHDALADAKAVVDVVSALADLQKVDDLEDLATSIGVRIGVMSNGLYKGSVVTHAGAGGVLVQPELDPNADPEGYLYGRMVVFTGSLMSMTRQIAWEECSRIGAIAEKEVTKRTNVLVVGDINPAVLRPGSNLTGKARKAFELQDKGQEIEVMTEDDFLRCLTGSALEGIHVLNDQSQGQFAAPPETDSPQNRTTAVPKLRSVPLRDRPEPKPTPPPKALRRTPTPTDQICSSEGCHQKAAFKSSSKPTWCTDHIVEIQKIGGLKPLESFTHPEDWQFMECLSCAVPAHYRFAYTLEKNKEGEPTCRACFWRRWADHGGPRELVPLDEAKTFAEEHGYDYLGPLTTPSYQNDPHHVRCRRCTRISAQRLGDIHFGCSCKPK